MSEFNPGGAASLNAAVKERYEANSNTNAFTDTEKAKLAAVEALATADQTGAEIKAAYEAEADTNALTDVRAAKVDNLTVTGAVDLDAINTRVASLDAAVILRGTWNASGGTFPGGGSAQAGDSYIVSVGGTVNGVVFTANDRIIAILDNASTTTYAANWHKADYTDEVLSVAGLTGAISTSNLKIALAYSTVANTGQYSDLAGKPTLGSLAALSTVDTAQLAAKAVQLGKMDDLAADTILGRANGAGTGAPQPLSAAQVATILGAAVGALDARLLVYNNTGSTITKGKPAYLSGYNSGATTPQITTADADGTGTMPCIGIVLADIATGATGYVILAGEIVGLDTSGRTINDPLYISTTGTLTATAPTTGLVQEVARVSRVDATLGEIVVGIRSPGVPINNGAAQLDVNGNEVLVYGVVASAVNQARITNAATGNDVKIEAEGGDTNIGLNLVTKGTGKPKVNGVEIVDLTTAQVQTNKDLTDPKMTLTPNAQTGTTYTLVLGDRHRVITSSNASAQLHTIPLNSSVAFPVGTMISFLQIGAGVLSIKGATGVTLNGVSAGTGAIAARYTGATILKTATDTWVMYGNHGAVA